MKKAAPETSGPKEAFKFEVKELKERGEPTLDEVKVQISLLLRADDVERWAAIAVLLRSSMSAEMIDKLLTEMRAFSERRKGAKANARSRARDESPVATKKKKAPTKRA